MNTNRGCIRAVLGAIAIFIIHIPMLIWSLLLLSYAAAFNNRPNLTADPSEQLARARKLLKRKHNSLLLYAALEIRFCIERITKGDIYIESISNRARKKYEPEKLVSILHSTEPVSKDEHRMILRNRIDGTEIDIGLYKPLDKQEIGIIQGKLGNLLHPKVGIPLGVGNSEWYQETRDFLWDTHHYLENLLKDRRPFEGDTDLENVWEFVRINHKVESNSG